MRRCQFELRKALARLHLLEGYLIALDNIDEVIRIVRSSKDGNEARPRLRDSFGLSEIQAQAILDMRLQRLTGLERDKIVAEQQELQALTEELRAILASETRLMEVIKEELMDVRNRFADERRTRIQDAVEDISILDLIEDEEQVITMSIRGYIKRMSNDEFQEQRRGGKGKRGVKSNKEDAAKDIFMANTKSDLLVFTTRGIMYKLPVYKIPETSRNAAGTPIINLLPIEKDDKIATVLRVFSFDDESLDLVFCSTKGLVKRTALTEYKNVRRSGLIAYSCADGDQLLNVLLCNESSSILMNTTSGKSIHFKGTDVRRMGRSTRGVKGITLAENDSIASMVEVTAQSEQLRLLTITEKGFGKRTPLKEYRQQKRGGSGVIDINTGVRNGSIVGSLLVEETDRVMLITENGLIIKIPVLNIRDQSRNTKGVTVMRVPDADRIVSIAKVLEEDDEETTVDETVGTTEVSTDSVEENSEKSE